MTPPPLENVPQGSVAQFVNTSGAATPGVPTSSVQSERAHYFDAGLTHHFTPEYLVGLDGYYKVSQNTLDDGQFGAAPILSAFNYQRGQICGLELTQNYTQKKGISVHGNLAVEQGIGTQVNSAQSVLFNAADYDYISIHYIYLDHSQTFTGSFGLSYDLELTETVPYLEMICGSGFRSDTNPGARSNIPNGNSLAAYDSVNVGLLRDSNGPGCRTCRPASISLMSAIRVTRFGMGPAWECSQRVWAQAEFLCGADLLVLMAHGHSSSYDFDKVWFSISTRISGLNGLRRNWVFSGRGSLSEMKSKL